MKHVVKNLHARQVSIALIGVGGTGSLVLSGLVRLNHALRKLGHPGIEVNVYDPDIVTEANIGRQLFTSDEIGQNKAQCLIDRYNLGFALDWNAYPGKYQRWNYQNQILISCVDSKASRREIAGTIPKNTELYLIDSGNDGNFGQVLIGENRSKDFPLPYEVQPDLVKGKEIRHAPSCSLAEALSYQDLFINQWMATAILQLLWQMFRRGELTYRGFYINLETGRMNPVPIGNTT